MGMPKAVRDQMKKESRGTVAPSPAGNISQKDADPQCPEGWDPEVRDVELAKRLAKELKHPEDLGDTYAADQVRAATKRIQELFSRGPMSLWLPRQFERWHKLVEFTKAHEFPNAWSSKDPVFIGSLHWAERVLAGDVEGAKKVEAQLWEDFEAVHAEREIAEVVDGIEYRLGNAPDEIYLNFGFEDDDELQKGRKAVEAWCAKADYGVEWMWFDNGMKPTKVFFKVRELRKDSKPATAPAADDTRDGTVCRITSRLGTDAENEKAEREIREWAAKRGYRITSKVRDGENRQVVFTMAGKPGRRNAPSLEEIVYGGKGWKKDGGGAWNSLMTLAWWAAVIYVVGYIGWKAYGRYLAAQ